VAVAVEGEETSDVVAKPVKEAGVVAKKVPVEKQKCTACTSKKEPCKFSALKGEVFCKRHLRAAQEEADPAAPKEKPVKKAAAKAEQPVHTHSLTENAKGECELCESHGNPLEPEAEFEVVGEASGSPPVKPMTAAERLAAILADSDDEDEESDADDRGCGLMEEEFEDDE
jgi:hypothetical protein